MSFRRLQKVSEFNFEPEVTERYALGDVLGKGAYGTVYQGQCLTTKKEVAIKFISKARVGNAVEKVEREIGIMKALDHPRILQMYGHITTPLNYVIIMEKVDGGELLHQLLKVKRYTERKACRVIFNLLRALRYMHERKFMHCDLKPENLLLVKAPVNDEEVTSIKLADFGLARPVRPGAMPTTACGSPMYIAPEVIEAGVYKTRSHYNEKADLWSVGIITYLLVSGMIPFYAPTPKEIFKLVVTAPHSFDNASWEHISPEARDFVDLLLTKNPDDRPSAAETLTHQWMELCANPDDDDDIDLPEALAGLREFNAQQKLKGAIVGVEATLRMAYMAGASRAAVRPNSAVLTQLSVLGNDFTKIDLSNNYLGSQGLSVLCDTLTSLSSLTTLVLSNVLMGDEHLDRLVPFFLRPSCMLHTLVCDANELSHTGGRVLYNLVRGRSRFRLVSAERNHIKESILERIREQCKMNRQLAGIAD